MSKDFFVDSMVFSIERVASIAKTIFKGYVWRKGKRFIDIIYFISVSRLPSINEVNIVIVLLCFYLHLAIYWLTLSWFSVAFLSLALSIISWIYYYYSPYKSSPYNSNWLFKFPLLTIKIHEPGFPCRPTLPIIWVYSYFYLIVKVIISWAPPNVKTFFYKMIKSVPLAKALVIKLIFP